MSLANPPGSRRIAYSRIVGILKIALPLVALVLLSLVFLLARTVDLTQAVRYATVDVQDLARDPRLSGARFAGVTTDGAALTIQSETARSDPGGALRLNVTGLQLRIENDAGLVVAAQAESGAIDRARGVFEMSGGLRVQTAQGYDLHTERVLGALDRTRLIADRGISGAAPAGVLQAGRMEIIPDPDDAGGYVLVFRDGVRLNYVLAE